jgi:hypothetical protein
VGPLLRFGWVGGPAGSKIQTEVGPAPEGRAKKRAPEGRPSLFSYVIILAVPFGRYVIRYVDCITNDDILITVSVEV